MRSLRAMLVLAAIAAVAVAEDSIPTKRPRPFLRGVCLTLHDEDPDHDYSPELAEIDSRVCASHVSIVFRLWQPHADSKVPGRGELTPSDAALRAVARAARARGLATLLMPVVLLEEPRPGEWRGNLTPKDKDAWLEAYRALLVGYARLAEEEKVSLLCIGSELGFSQKNPLWTKVISDVRGAYSGRLIYSANWDDYENVPFWDQLDAVGLSGYYELAKEPGASDATLRAAWRAQRDAILAWRAKTAPSKPLIFTEIGYASQRGCSVHPWDYTSPAPADSDEQRRCYEAFIAAWARTNELGGAFFYEWIGEGGEQDRSYTPRDKPAESVLRRFFSDLKVVEKR